MSFRRGQWVIAAGAVGIFIERAAVMDENDEPIAAGRVDLVDEKGHTTKQVVLPIIYIQPAKRSDIPAARVLTAAPTVLDRLYPAEGDE